MNVARVTLTRLSDTMGCRPSKSKVGGRKKKKDGAPASNAEMCQCYYDILLILLPRVSTISRLDTFRLTLLWGGGLPDSFAE